MQVRPGALPAGRVRGVVSDPVSGRAPATEPAAPSHAEDPVWCKYVPVQYREEACRSASRISTAHSPTTTLGEAPATELAASGHAEDPVWCNYVPVQYREEACGGVARHPALGTR